MKGKFLAVLLTLSLCLGLMACASQSSTSTESDATATSQETGVTEETEASDANNTTASNNETEYPALRVKDNLTVGYVVMDVKADSQMRSLWQAKIECARRGWTFVDGSCEGDELTRDAINNLINQDVDVIVLGCMALMDAKVDLIQKAREAGIGVYCNDNQVVEGVVAGSTMRNGAATVDLLYQVCNDYNWDLNCCITYENNQVNLERYKVGAGLMDNVYPNLKFLAADDTTATSTFYLQAAYDYTQTWIQKYGDDLDCIFSTWDGEGMSAAEAISQAGDANGDDIFVCGIDGGSSAWAYIRNNTPLRYTYSQPFELYTHNLFEIIGQLQQEGLQPGDEGCDIQRYGDTVYASGLVTTRENVPEVGQSVHAVFDYYGMDPEDPDAWFNWTDGPGIYYVTDGSENDSIADQIATNS